MTMSKTSRTANAANANAVSVAAHAVSAEGHPVADHKTRRRFKEVWMVEDRPDAKSIWTRVGTAFENQDGSWNIRLSALPVGSGRLNMRDPIDRSADRADRADRAANHGQAEQAQVAA